MQCVSAIPRPYKCAACETTDLRTSKPSAIRSADGQCVIGLLCGPCTARALADEGYRFQVELAVFHGLTRKDLALTLGSGGIPLAGSLEEQQALIREFLDRNDGRV